MARIKLKYYMPEDRFFIWIKWILRVMPLWMCQLILADGWEKDPHSEQEMQWEIEKKRDRSKDIES